MVIKKKEGGETINDKNVVRQSKMVKNTQHMTEGLCDLKAKSAQ